jgi:hypothetical protein
MKLRVLDRMDGVLALPRRKKVEYMTGLGEWVTNPAQRKAVPSHDRLRLDQF